MRWTENHRIPGPPPPFPGICSDGVDNDADCAIDFPEDPGCESAGAATEAPQCEDRLDNDGDGQVDGDDPHCAASPVWWGDESAAEASDSTWVVVGSALGGTIDLEIHSVSIQVETSAGQTAAEVAAAIVAAWNGHATLAAAGLVAYANGSRIETAGSITSWSIGDSGLVVVPEPATGPATAPGLSRLGLALMLGALAITGGLVAARRARASPDGPG